MELIDLRSGAMAVFFFVVIVHLVFLGWMSEPRPAEVKHKADLPPDEQREAA